MRTFTYLKRFLIVAALPLMLGGCLDSKEADFNFSASAYILQRNNGGAPTFAPYIGIFSPYQQLQSASVASTANPYMTVVKRGTNAYETPLYFSGNIPNDTYSVTATSVEGKSANNKYRFNIESTKKLGTLEVTKLEYKTGTNAITAEWKKVENASAYYLMYSVGVKNDGGMYDFYRINNAYIVWNPYNATDTQGTYTLNALGLSSLPNGSQVHIAVVAVYNSSDSGLLVLEGDKYLLKVGEEGLLQVPNNY